jgi:hypothetical protein
VVPLPVCSRSPSQNTLQSSRAHNPKNSVAVGQSIALVFHSFNHMDVSTPPQHHSALGIQSAQNAQQPTTATSSSTATSTDRSTVLNSNEKRKVMEIHLLRGKQRPRSLPIPMKRMPTLPPIVVLFQWYRRRRPPVDKTITFDACQTTS